VSDDGKLRRPASPQKRSMRLRLSTHAAPTHSNQGRGRAGFTLLQPLAEVVRDARQLNRVQGTQRRRRLQRYVAREGRGRMIGIEIDEKVSDRIDGLNRGNNLGFLPQRARKAFT